MMTDSGSCLEKIAVPEAQALGPEFTVVSCDLAENYLSTFG